jgi:Ca2+-binding RTX toxin-like protein
MRRGCGVSRQPRKGKVLVRRTILFLGTMLVLLVGAGGVAFSLVQCDQDNYCSCTPGVLCEGTHDTRPAYYDSITGTPSGDKIFAYEGDDEIYGYGSGDYIDAGPGNDTVVGDSLGTNGGNDTLIGGDGDDYIAGGEGVDQCYGGPGYDEFLGCDKEVQ